LLLRHIVILREEGARALYQGLPVAILIYSGFLVGFYSKVRDFLGEENKG